ncbi:MAG TPA: preprotein translocase subunit SecG [Candidatus Saccharimonadales bacterium]|nr:preprotein translocase subunit SecG [Candidatus Saccharimonadales bacterium]
MQLALKFITIGSAALMILLILVQQRGASLGAGFGASSELYTTRRGTDKTLHEITVIVAVIFVVSLVVGLVRG